MSEMPLRMSGLNPTSHDKPKYYKANQTDGRAAPPSHFSDLELFCTAASEIEISCLQPEDLTGITDALEAYYALQRRQPLADIARRVANEVKRTMPDDGRSDHKRVVGWFSGVATRTLRRCDGGSVAGTTRNPGKLHSDVAAGGDQQDGWREEYERAQKWHESRRGDVDGRLPKASGEG